MRADDLVEASFDREPERQRSAGVETARPPSNDAFHQRVGFAADAGHHLVASDAFERCNLLADGAADAGDREINAVAKLRAAKPRRVDEKADRRARAGMPMHYAVGNRQGRLLSGQWLADDAGEEPGGSLVWLARPHANRRQTDANPLEKAAPCVVGEQQLGHRFLRSVGGERRQMEVVGNGFRERRAEHRDRGGENESWLVVADRAHRLEQCAGAVEVDAVALLEISFRFARNYAGEMEDHVRLFRHGLFRGAWCRKIDGADLDVIGEAWRPLWRAHVDQRQLVDRLGGAGPGDCPAGGELWADQTPSAREP